MKSFSDQNVYYDVNIANLEQVPKPAFISEERSTAILERGDDYTMSVIRFLIPGTAIPIFVMENSPHPFFIGLRYQANPIINQVITYDPSWNPAVLPKGSITSYAQFLAYINQALANITSVINNTYSVSLSYPRMWFDSSTNLFAFRFKDAGEATDLTIYMCSALYELFPTFPAKIISSYSPGGNDVELMMDVNDPATHTGTNYDLKQEVPSQYALNGLRRIFLQSSILNTRPEYQYATTGDNVVMPILTDFEPQINGDYRTNDVFQYQPIGEFRRLDIIGRGPITKINFQFYWQDKWGHIYPLLIPPNQFLSLKILFERKLKF